MLRQKLRHCFQFYDDLVKADEVWLTSSGLGVIPVIRIDGSTVGDGKPGKLWARINTLFQEFKSNPAIRQ